MKIFIGTSGYSYKHWANGVFYPAGLPSSKWLEYYCEHFKTVELNVTFYRLPKKAAFAGWAKKTPRDFRFAIKGSRYITHIKRLKDPKDSLRYIEENVQPLLSKIECVLWQLPPGFKKNEERLDNFCAHIRKQESLSRLRHVFEFRDNSWFCQNIYGILKHYRHILCFANAPRQIGEEVVLSDSLYLRFHGARSLYASDYSEDELRQWSKKIKGYGNSINAVHAYFNNDARGYAPKNARVLRYLLQKS